MYYKHISCFSARKSKNQKMETGDSTTKRVWGTDTYSKWDKMDFEDSLEEKAKRGGQTFALGDQYVPSGGEVLGDDALETLKTKTILGLEETKETYVWAVDVLPMRCWSAGTGPASVSPQTGDPYPTRPLVILISELYPRGRLLTHAIPTTTSCDLPPSPLETLDLLSKEIRDPTGGDKQHRPSKVVFTDKALLDGCHMTLRHWNVEPSYIDKPADGIMAYVREVSNLLVRKDIARDSGEVSALPSLIMAFNNNNNTNLSPSKPPVPQELLDWMSGYYSDCARLVSLDPWSSLTARSVFRLNVRSPLPFCPLRDPVKGDDIYVSAVQDGDLVGIGIWRSRLDAEARLVPAEAGGAVHRAGGKRCYVTGGANCKGLKPKMFDVRTGREIAFEGQEEQRKGWKHVKKYARPMEQRDDRTAQWNGESECSLMFKHLTLVPFSDLDEISEFGFAVAKGRGEGHFGVGGKEDCVYPVPARVVRGELMRPLKEDIAAIRIACGALSSLLEDEGKRGEVMKSSFAAGAGGEVKMSLGSSKVEVMGVEVEIEHEPIYMKSEVEAAVKRATANMAEKEKALKDKEAKIEELKAQIEDAKISQGAEGQDGAGADADEGSDEGGRSCIVS